jgi:hypothetical protein
MLVLMVNAAPGTAGASVLAPRAAPQATAASAPAFKVVPAPDPDPQVAGTTDVGFTAVAAASATDALAVGPNPTEAPVQGPFADHWNGTAWTGMQLPAPPGSTASLLGVADVAPGNGWAVGFSTSTATDQDQTLIEHWNGTSWSTVSTPSVNAGSNPIEKLTAVTAVSATDLWASGWVGNIDNENKLEPIILHSAGGAWSRVTAPNSGSEGSRLNGITSDGADDVFAVGTTQESNGSLLTLIEQFNGSSWKAIPSPDPGQARLAHRQCAHRGRVSSRRHMGGRAPSTSRATAATCR